MIGVDYPMPIIDHKIVSQRNIGRMKIIFAGGTIDKDDNNEEEKKSSEITSSVETKLMKT